MEKLTPPHIGMRTIKTAVAVTLSYLIFVPFGLLYNGSYPGALAYIGPLYACIPCVVCMQSSLEQTFQVGLARFLGVLVGAVIGALMILIPEPVFNFWVVKAALLGLSCVAGILLCTKVLHRPAACTMACVLPCVMALSGSLPGEDRHYYALARVVETMVGVSVAFLVNAVLPAQPPSRPGLSGPLPEPGEPSQHRREE